MDKVEQIIAELRRIIESYGGETFGPVAEERLRAAEQELGLPFPLSYRLFLGEFGAVNYILDLDLNGLPDTRDTDKEQPWFSNVIDQTQSWRVQRDYPEPLKVEPLMPYLIDIGSHGGGESWFFLDTTKVDEDGEAPVLIQSHEIPLQVFAPSFVDFLRKLSDEAEPFAHVVKHPPRSRPVSPATEPVEEAEPRDITWLEVEPGTFVLDKPPIAHHFGIDEGSREVFVHAKTLGLDLEQQLEAMAAGEGFFANPTGRGGFGEPFVAIDYLIAHHPELAEASRLNELRRWVLDTFDRWQAEGDE